MHGAARRGSGPEPPVAGTYDREVIGMCERLTGNAWVIAGVIAAILVAAVILNALFVRIAEVNALIVILAVGTAMLLAAAHVTGSCSWPRAHR